MSLGQLVRVLDPSGTWYGLVRAVSVAARLPSIVQSVVLERHTKLIPGTFSNGGGSAVPPLAFVGPIPTLLVGVGIPASINTAPYWVFGQPTQLWSMRSGALPPGLTLNKDTGVISGTPTTLGTTPGLALRVVDGILNMADSNAFSIEAVPVVAAGSVGTFAMTGASTGVVAEPVVNGASSGTFAMTGSATGSTTVPIEGASSGTFAMTGSAAGSAIDPDPLWSSVFSLTRLNEATTGTAVVDAKGHSTTPVPGYTNGLPDSQASGKFGRCRQTGGGQQKLFWVRGTEAELAAWHTGSWCVEGHVYFSSSAGAYLVGVFRDANSVWTDGGFFIYRDRFDATDGEDFSDSASFTAVAHSTWVHFAVTMETSGANRIYKLYLDGVLKATLTSTTYVKFFDVDAFGFGGASGSVSRYDEIRVTMGNLRYTAAFTPPSAEFPAS
jgi:hypothetical protein